MIWIHIHRSSMAKTYQHEVLAHAKVLVEAEISSPSSKNFLMEWHLNQKSTWFELSPMVLKNLLYENNMFEMMKLAYVPCNLTLEIGDDLLHNESLR